MSEPIAEHDVVVFVRDLPDAGISVGDTGAVVHVYPGAADAYEVESVAARRSPAGGAAGVVTVRGADILKLKSARFRTFAESLVA